MEKTNEKPDKETSDKWLDDTDNYKWGIFYYNPRDPRIFPPKRIRWTGWTVNFANPYSIVAMIVVVIIIVLINYFITR